MYIEKYDKYYPHKYETIITKDLFNKCQAITQKRNEHGKKVGVQVSKKEFIFRSLVTCSITGRRVSCDKKTNRHGTTYNYLYTWNPKDLTKKIAVNENELLNCIESVFKSFTMPEDLLNEITNHLQKSNKTEKEFYKNKAQELNKANEDMIIQENRLLGLYLKQKIDEPIFNQKSKELEIEKEKIKTEIANYANKDKASENTMITAVELISKAYKLFEISKIDEKRQLINFIFSNLKLNGNNPDFIIRKPFDMLVNLESCPYWRAERDSNPR